MDVSEICSDLDLQLGLSVEEDRLEIATETLGAAYGVHSDEVALFSVDYRLEVLRFLWPAHLRNSGTIPLSSKSSLVARTARENRGYLDNHFAKTTHSFIFEFVPDKTGKGASCLPIQKILSVPVLDAGGKPKGVLQISRKGPTQDNAGPDFGKDDLLALQRMSEVLSKYI